LKHCLFKANSNTYFCRRGPHRNLPPTVPSRTTDHWKRRCC